MSTAVITDVRERAAARFRELGWPTPRIEEWKYTNLAPVAKVDWKLASGNAQEVGDNAGMSYAGIAVAELTFVNGRLVGDVPEELPAGLTIRPFDGELTFADDEPNALVALNASLANGGAIIEATKPIEGFVHLLFVGRGEGIWSHPRNIIRVARGAQLTIVESYVGSGSYFTNVVTELELGEGAVVDHYKVECESLEAYHVGTLRIRQERASSVIARSIAIGGALVRNDVTAILGGQGASVALDGLFIGAGTQHLDNHTVIDHAKPHCDSQEVYKGILDGKARGIFDGKIIVRPDAVKTASRQVNKNLLLSETAIVDSKPTLEIYNDDVKCNHGSTIGQLDEESMFYLRTRGIAADEARSLLVFAFASELVERMKIEPVREQIRRAMFRQMPDRLPERRGAGR